MTDKQDSPDMRERHTLTPKEIVEKEVASQKEFGYEPSWEDFVIAGILETEALYSGKLDEFYTAGCLASPTAKQAYDRGEKAGKVLGAKEERGRITNQIHLVNPSAGGWVVLEMRQQDWQALKKETHNENTG